MIPSIFFSILYILFFSPEEFTRTQVIVNILSGAGHMWFLPNVFWCFILMRFVSQFNLDKRIIFTLLCGLSLLPNPIPFGIGNACHYLIYFYLGTILYERKVNSLLNIKRHFIIILWVVFFVSTVVLRIIGRPLLMNYIDIYGIYSKLIVLFTINAIQLLIMFSSSLAIYFTVVHLIKNCDKISNVVVYASRLSFGVYICHQFILKDLYYHTSLSNYVSPYIFPWIGFIISLVSSLFITYYLLKIKIGRLLIS